jgi:hypothetical protein
MSSHWKAVFGIILIFLFGCLAGAVSTSIFFHHRMLIVLQHPAASLSAALEKRLTRNLNLDANQQQQIHGYFLENLDRRKELQKQNKPEVQLLNHRTLQEIVADLRPDQAEQFRKNVRESRQRSWREAPDPDDQDGAGPLGQASNDQTNSGTNTPPATPGQ